MSELTHDLPAVRIEQIRQELSAMLFFAVPPDDIPEAAKFDAHNRVKAILGVIDMLAPDYEIDWPGCEGCGKVIGHKEPYATFSDDDHGSLYFCAICTPDPAALNEINGNPIYADQDIARARKWCADLMREDDDAALSATVSS